MLLPLLAAKGSSAMAKTAKAFTFRELATATKNFRSDCFLGEGGFGRVYKGQLENGQVYTIMINETFLILQIQSCSLVTNCSLFQLFFNA